MSLYPIWIHDRKTPKPDSPVLYEISANGVFLHKETPFWKAVVPVRRISILEEQRPSFELRLPPIPKDLAFSVAQFFSWIAKIEDSEALALLWWTDKYEVLVPPQRVSRGHVDYEIPKKEGGLLIGTLHSHGNIRSHGSLSAFHSPLDRHDERNFDGLHVTFGDFSHPSKREFSLSVQASINDCRFLLDPLAVFEGLQQRKIEPDACFNFLSTGRTSAPHPQQDQANNKGEQQRQPGEKIGIPERLSPKPEKMLYSFPDGADLVPPGYLPPQEWMQGMYFERRSAYLERPADDYLFRGWW